MTSDPSENPANPRVPPPKDGIQINTCRRVGCENFGVEPLLEVTKGRPAKGVAPKQDGFRVVGASKRGVDGGLKALYCSKCGGSVFIKSNIAIKEELDRITGVRNAPSEPSCKTIDCPNRGDGRFSHPELYYANGKTKAGTPRYKCKECGKSPRGGPITRRQQKTSHLNRLVFSLLINKTPIRGIMRVTGLNPKTVYDIIDRIHEKCVAFAAEREKELATRSWSRLYISCDRQDYVINWTDRAEKFVTQFTAVASCENRSGYVFGTHLNFDARASRIGVNKMAEVCDDPGITNPAFRRYARLWLDHEFEDAQKRDPGLDCPPHMPGTGVTPLILAAEAEAKAVPDPEAMERVFHTSQLPKSGMQTHFEYTVYAHFLLLARMVANAEKVRFFIDQDETLKAGVFNAFKDRIAKGEVDAFFVKINKALTVDQKRDLVGQSNDLIRDTREELGNPEATDRSILLFLISLELHKMRKASGLWRDWLRFPISTMYEPQKAVRYVTDRGDFNLDDPDECLHLARLYSRASLYGVDLFFQALRRLVMMLERPISTPSNVGRVWRGYSAYNPKMVQKLLDIFRVAYNYTESDPERLRKKMRTPAMKIGIAKGYIRLDEILYHE